MGANFWGGNLGSKIFWNEFLQVKFHSGKNSILGSKNVMERKIWGGNFWERKNLCEEKFAEHNLGSKIFSG